MSQAIVVVDVSDEELRQDALRQKETAKERDKRQKRESRERMTEEEKQAAYKKHKLYVQANKEAIAARNKATRKANKERAIEFLGGKCNKCGGSFPSPAMDFHHEDEDGKEKSVATMWHNKWEVIVEEIKKCVLLCANCHRIEHFHG